MKIFFSCSTFLLVLFAFEVLADKTYLCTYGQDERVISVIYQDQQQQVPCEVRYQHDGMTEVAWTAQIEKGYCERKARDFVQQQLARGWSCNDFSTQLPKSSDDSSQQIVDYKQAALFAQALSVMSAFRVRVMEYYAMNGEYPLSLEDLDLSRADMRDSAYISDLTVGELGSLYALGGAELGEEVIIRLAPKQTLGGMSTEWRCHTTIELISDMRCEHDDELHFPGSW